MVVEVNDIASVIPRNSIIEANQSGLIAEPLLDVTPQLPLPTYTAGPTEPGCGGEGAILCAGGRMTGRPGVALDDLVYIMTRMARQMEQDGMDKVRPHAYYYYHQEACKARTRPARTARMRTLALAALSGLGCVSSGWGVLARPCCWLEHCPW